MAYSIQKYWAKISENFATEFSTYVYTLCANITCFKLHLKNTSFRDNTHYTFTVISTAAM